MREWQRDRETHTVKDELLVVVGHSQNNQKIYECFTTNRSNLFSKQISLFRTKVEPSFRTYFWAPKHEDNPLRFVVYIGTERQKSENRKKTEKQKDRKTERQKDRETEIQKDRKTERRKDSKTERQKKSFCFQFGFPKTLTPTNIPGKQEKTLLVIIMRITQTSKKKWREWEKHMT